VFKFSSIVVALSLILMVSSCVTSNSRKSTVDAKKAHDSHLNLGLTYLQRDNREGARRHFEKALQLEPDSAAAHNGLARLYALTGEFALAEKSFQRAISEDSSFTQARVSYARFLYEQGRYPEAYKSFEVATQDLSSPQRALALAYLGQTALKLDDKLKAKSLFEHSVNIDNKLAIPLIELGDLYFDEQDYAKSKEYLDRYTEVAGRTSRSLWLGIRIERIFGNKDKEASYALALKNLHPYSQEYLAYKKQLSSENK
jgi:type IV pilus assembly protein PilF